MTDEPTTAAAAAAPDGVPEPNSTDPGPNKAAPTVKVTLAQLMAELEHHRGELEHLRVQQGLHGQLLVAQNGVLTEVRGLMQRFGPLLDSWASSNPGRLAAAIRGRR